MGMGQDRDEPRILSTDDLRILQVGREYEQLVKMASWKMLLDWFNDRADAALTAHKLCMSSDVLIEQLVKAKWRNADEVFIELQKHIYGAIERKRILVQQLLDSGATPSQLETALSTLPPTVQ